MRQPIGILYVAVPELKIHEQPSETSPVVATYREAESVTIYSNRGEWAEVQLFEERSGWARRSELTDQKAGTHGDPSKPRFRVPPSPVWSQKKVHGEIVFEATVNESGTVLSVRTLANSTGDAALEARNRAELMQAKFYPLIRSGGPKPFVYEYRVTY